MTGQSAPAQGGPSARLTDGLDAEQTNPHSESPRRTVIVGISGCSSSGKTTLSRYLRDLFPSVFILHQDDFYRPEEELPFKAGLRDWDCAGAIDIPALVAALEHIHAQGTVPPSLESKEDQNQIGPSHVPEETMDRVKTVIRRWTESFGRSNHHNGEDKDSVIKDLPRIALIDGFLLYGTSVRNVLLPHFDVKLLTRAPYARAKARREARSGYVTLEGFWEDPPGYVDDVVWPNYVADHADLFENGDVEGNVNPHVLEKLGVHVTPRLDMQMGELLEWAVEAITSSVR